MYTVARRFLIVPSVLGAMAADRKDVEDQVSSMYLAVLAGEVIQDLPALRPEAERQQKRLATLSPASTIRLAFPRGEHGTFRHGLMASHGLLCAL